MKIEAALSRRNTPHPTLEEVEIGEPQPGEILVRIKACGICGTDLGAHAGGTPKPIVLGHEGAGIVERVGEGVTTIEPGTHVLLCGDSCGHCRNCRRNLPGYCDESMRRNFGGLRADKSTALSQNGTRLFAQFFGQSSFAQFAIAPAHSAVIVPDDLALETLAPLACGVSTGAGAIWNDLELGVGDTIAIFGAGSVGLSAIMAAKFVGAARIVAVDRVSSRLDIARELGASDTIDASRENAAAALRALIPNGVDFSFNTTTGADIFALALECLALRGTAAFVAGSSEAVPLSTQSMLSGGKTLKAILGCGADPRVFIPRLIDEFRAGRFPFDRLIKTYPFAAIAEAFDDMATGRTIKPVLVM